jgi:hypothetical protein
LSSSGREIVGLGYSAGPAIETLAWEDQQKQQQITPDVQGTEMPKDNTTGTRKMPQPRWCPVGLTKTQRRRLQKLRKAEIEREKAEIERDKWFNRARPMTTIKKTWREKMLAREERDDDEDIESSSENDARQVEVNMVFELPSEFQIPEDEVAELALGAKAAVFQKPERLGVHMKPLFIRGYLQGKPMQKIMVDSGDDVNVMPLMTFNKMGYRESDLMRTNTSLSVFTGEVTETKGVISAELAIGNKTLATAFFVVDVGGRYNLLLGRDWIHANGCVPSTLHQRLI